MDRTLRLRSLTLAFLLTALVVGPASVRAEIPWTQDYAAAKGASESSGAVMLLHFYSNDCVPCKMLDARAFQDPMLIQAIKRTVIPVKVNVDNFPEIAQQYSVNRWPTDVYIAADGTELARSISPQKTGDYIALLDRVAVRNRDHVVIQRAGQIAQQNPQPRQIAVHREPPSALFPSADTAASLDFPAATPTADAASVNSLAGAGNSALPPIRNDVRSNQAPTFEVPKSQMAAALGQSAFAPPTAPNPAFESNWNPPATQTAQVPQAPPPNSMQSTTPPATQAFPGPNGSTVENRFVQRSNVPPSSAGNFSIPNQTSGNAGFSAAPVVASMQTPPNIDVRQNSSPNAAWAPMAAASAQANLVSSTSPAANPAANVGQPQNLQPMAQAQDANPATMIQRKIEAEVRKATSEVAGPAMSGYCPVTLDEKSTWTPGNPAFAVRHRGRIYYLASQEGQKKFLEAPDRYAPILGGYDIVHFLHTGVLIDGLREYGCWYKGRVYLFATEQNRQYFDDNVINVAASAEQLQRAGSKPNSGNPNENQPDLDPSQGRIADGASESTMSR